MQKTVLRLTSPVIPEGEVHENCARALPGHCAAIPWRQKSENRGRIQVAHRDCHAGRFETRENVDLPLINSRAAAAGSADARFRELAAVAFQLEPETTAAIDAMISGMPGFTPIRLRCATRAKVSLLAPTPVENQNAGGNNKASKASSRGCTPAIY